MNEPKFEIGDVVSYKNGTLWFQIKKPPRFNHERQEWFYTNWSTNGRHPESSLTLKELKNEQ